MEGIEIILQKRIEVGRISERLLESCKNSKGVIEHMFDNLRMLGYKEIFISKEKHTGDLVFSIIQAEKKGENQKC